MFESVFKPLVGCGLHGSGTLPQTTYNAAEFLVYRAKFNVFSWRESRERRFGREINAAGFWLPLFRRYNFNPSFPLYTLRGDGHIISYEVL